MNEREAYDDRGTIDYEDLPRRAGVFPLTDLGNAEYFAWRYGEQIRFDHRRARWLLYRDHRWALDADAEIRRLAIEAMRARLRDAADLDDESIRARAVKWALGSETRSRVESLLWFASSLPSIADAGDRWDDDPWLLGVPNGVVDLHTGTLRDGTTCDRLTMQAGVPYNPAARCPRWEQFIAEIFGEDAALMTFIQRAIGYTLTGITTEQCLFLLYGTGANGKGTFIGTLITVLGDYAWNMPFSTIEMRDRAAIPNDLAALVGRRLVSASETNDGTRLNESRIKALTGCDPITARFLHGEFFTFDPVTKFWLSVNHKPVVRDDSHGFWRRLRLIPLTRVFPVNRTLATALATEAPGILAWAVSGCLAWQRQGLTPPDVVQAATQEYETDSDPLAAFIEEACEPAPDAEVAAGALFAHYTRWASWRGLNERERLSATAFGLKAKERLRAEHTRCGNVYYGLARRPFWESSNETA